MSEYEGHSNSQMEEFSITAYLRKFFRHKWFFILSVGICILMALGYLYLKTPVYRIQSALVIKDEKKGESISLTLKELDFLDEQKIVDNEAEIIRSESIVGKVVRLLNLNIAYYSKKNSFQYQPLFYESPIAVNVITASPELFETPIDIRFDKADQYLVKPGKFPRHFGDTIQLAGGARICITKTGAQMTKVPALRVVVSDPEETTQQLRAAINTSAASKNSSVLYVSMLHPSPQKGKEILAHIIEEYDQANIVEKRAQTDSIVALIEDRLTLIGQQVKNLETTEQSLKTNQGITFLNDDARFYLEQVKDNDKEYMAAQIQLDNIIQVENYLDNSSAMTAPPNSSLNDPVLTNMVTMLSQLQLQKAELEKKSGPQHPSVISISKQAEDIKNSLNQNIRLQKSSLEKKIGLLKKSQRQVNASISRVPANERSLLELMREKSIRESIYSYLLEKREEASISDATVFSKMRIVDPPFSTIKPVKPKKLVVLGAALLAGLLFPVIVIAARDGLQNKVSVENSKLYMPYAVAGYIPHVKRNGHNTLTEDKSFASEQFNWIATTFEKMDPPAGHRGRVIWVSSPCINDGKSFVSLNLAAGFARLSGKSILVDFDLRKNRMASLFTIREPDEFEQQLRTGSFDLEKLVNRISDISPDLYIIAGNARVENPSGLINSPHVATLFALLRDNFDQVIINTPPFNYFTDAYKLESFSDYNIMVLRHNHTPLQQLSRTRNIIDSGEIKTPLIINNGVPLEYFFGKKQLKAYYSYQYS